MKTQDVKYLVLKERVESEVRTSLGTGSRTFGWDHAVSGVLANGFEVGGTGRRVGNGKRVARLGI